MKGTCEWRKEKEKEKNIESNIINAFNMALYVIIDSKASKPAFSIYWMRKWTWKLSEVSLSSSYEKKSIQYISNKRLETRKMHSSKGFQNVGQNNRVSKQSS